MFNHFQNTVTGWPGGKPGADDSTRPERKSPKSKRVIIFSPHPDDDVVSMGGTFDRLVSQGHKVHIAYQVKGNIAVSDHDALKFIEVSKDMFKNDSKVPVSQLIKELTNNKPDKIDVRRFPCLFSYSTFNFFQMRKPSFLVQPSKITRPLPLLAIEAFNNMNNALH